VRIVSLLPSATESLFALGLGDQLVAVTHECDYPPEAASLPIVTRSTLQLSGRNGGAIDAEVSLAALEGRSLYAVDTAAILALEPDLVVAQDICDVCAIPADQVAQDLAGIRMIRQHPHSFDDVLADIDELARACGADSTSLMKNLHERIATAARKAKTLPPVRGVFLEWLDPPYRAGHWTPDLLALAGIEDPLARRGVPSVAMVSQEQKAIANLVGSWIDLWEVVQLHSRGRITLKTETHPLDDVNEVLGRLREGDVMGRAVLLPNGEAG